jgi:two-component system, sensor histidine kinase PdtaS
LNYLALYHTQLGDTEKALHYHLQALEGTKLLADTASISTNLSNVASVFIELKNWPKAEQYAGEAYRLASQKGYKTKKADASVHLARLRLQSGDHSGALARYDEAVNLYRATQNRIHLVECLLASARIEQTLGRSKSAEDRILEALQCAEDSKDLSKIAAAQCAYGAYFLQDAQSVGIITARPDLKSDAKNALQWLEKSAATAMRAGAKDLQQDVWRLLAEVHERAGNPALALFFHKRYAALKDSLLGAAQQKTIFTLETRYQIGEKEKQIDLLDAQNEVKNLRLAQSQRRQWFLLLGLAAAALLALFAFYTARVKQDANRKLAEKNELVSKALSEKELLLREIHHRVKNNLQVISGLLKLQSRHLSDSKARDALREGRNRVQSMALIHQNLYQEDNLTGVAAPEYIGKLTDALFRSYNVTPGQVELDTRIEPLRLDIDTAIPLGLILNELISNALKHAFPEGQSGKLDVSLQQTGESLQLKVVDNGVGMPAKKETKQSFGFQLIELLSEKLNAHVSFSGERGSTVELNILNYRLG